MVELVFSYVTKFYMIPSDASPSRRETYPAVEMNLNQPHYPCIQIQHPS